MCWYLISLSLPHFQGINGTPDTDGDGLSDSEEVDIHGTNPLVADTDGDGLNDGDEVITYGTDPNDLDTDGDGLNDGSEVDSGTNPLQKEPTTSPTKVRRCSVRFALTGQSTCIIVICLPFFTTPLRFDCRFHSNTN